MNIKLNQILTQIGAEILLITDGYNIHHLTGYRGHTGILVYLDNKVYILTDSRYTEQVSIEAPESTCIDIGIDGYSKTIVRIIKDELLCSTDNQKFKKNTKIKIGFENNEISYRQYKALIDAFEKEGIDFEMIPLEGLVDAHRQIKTVHEISKIEKAEAIGDEAFGIIINYISETLKSGNTLTEQEIALELEYQMKKLGAEGLSFDTIVASGKNSSLPHAMPGNKKIETGDFITMDFGCLYQGYCSDMTRTVYIGDTPSEKQLKVYQTVLKAQLAALAMIKPGIKCSDVDQCARAIIADAGYGDYFGHGLGHSVGLFIHEEPRFSKRCDDILQPGIVITVEPGIYLPGEFGVRIEDTIVVTENGYRNLARSPKELLCIH